MKSVLSALAALIIANSAAAADLPRVELATDRGAILLEVDPVRAPVTACNFLRYVTSGAYDGGTFFRTVRRDRPMGNPNPIDVIQGGVSAAAEAADGPPIPLERTSTTGFTHVAGVVSMARAEPDTATSSFFIVVVDSPSLDYGGPRNPDGQGFGAFGRVLSGMDVAAHIHQSPSADEKLGPAVVIRSARIVSGEACPS